MPSIDVCACVYVCMCICVRVYLSEVGVCLFDCVHMSVDFINAGPNCTARTAGKSSSTHRSHPIAWWQPTYKHTPTRRSDANADADFVDIVDTQTHTHTHIPWQSRVFDACERPHVRSARNLCVTISDERVLEARHRL